jgi:hypothetical protein
VRWISGRPTSAFTPRLRQRRAYRALGRRRQARKLPRARHPPAHLARKRRSWTRDECPKRSRVRIAACDLLEDFAAIWQFHAPVQPEQFADADEIATVKIPRLFPWWRRAFIGFGRCGGYGTNAVCARRPTDKIRSGKVEKKAREAQNPIEGKELREAELVGKQRAAEKDPEEKW